MQLPPLNIWDFTSLLLVISICLLIAAEITSGSYGLTNLIINKKKLRSIALFVCLLFLMMVVFNIINDIIA